MILLKIDQHDVGSQRKFMVVNEFGAIYFETEYIEKKHQVDLNYAWHSCQEYIDNFQTSRM